MAPSCFLFWPWKVQKAHRIVIVGGGSAGVEMAAEVKTEYPAKEVWGKTFSSQSLAMYHFIIPVLFNFSLFTGIGVDEEYNT